MRKIVLLLFAVVALNAHAQDVIVKKDGSTILAKVLEINPGDIKYKKFSNQSGPTYTIVKSEVMAINYESGDKDTFDAASPQEKPAEVVTQPAAPSAPSSPDDLDAATISKRNADIVKSHNSVEVDFKDRPKDKDGKILYCQLGIKEGALLFNNDVRMTLRSGDCYSFLKNEPNTFAQIGMTINTGMEVVIQNLRSQTIYIDLGNSFFIRNGEASPYYIPSATSSTVTSGTGTSVNLGAVAGAVGIGGAAGKLAGGVNVGGGTSHGTTNIVYSLRVIAIPPRSSKTLEYQQFFPGGSSFGPFTTVQHYKNDYDVKSRQQFKLKWGQKRLWSEDNSPLTFGVFVAYSFDENCQQTQNVHADFYLKSVMGVGYNMGQPFVMNHDLLTDNWNSVLYFAAKNN